MRAVTSIDEVPSSLWTGLLSANLFENPLWLAANEKAFVGRAIITFENVTRPFSVIVWRALSASDHSPYHNITDLLKRWDVDTIPTDHWTLSVTGAGLHSSLLSESTVDENALRAHLDAAISFAHSSYGFEGAPSAIGVNFLRPTPPAGLDGALRSLRFSSIEGYRRAWLNLPGNSFQDYLASLNSEHRRNVRKDLERFQASGQSIQVTTGMAGYGDDLAVLQAANLDKYGLPANISSMRSRHKTLLTTFGDDSLVIRSVYKGTTTGFCMFFRGVDTLHALFAGFQPGNSVNGPYFQVVFHSAIEWVYKTPLRIIDYGIGGQNTTIAKKGRGCAVEPVTSWFRAT